MPTAAAPLKLFQWGREATAGTAVAATSKIAVESMDFEPEDLVVRPRLANGMMVENPGNELVTMRGTRWTARGPVLYDQLQNWLEMLIVGSVSPTGTNPYTWTYTRDPATVPALKSFTLERRITDGSNPIDNEWAYAMARSLRITAALNEPLRFEAEGFARRVQSSTLTAAQSLPTVEIPPIALTKAYIDTAWAGIGGTQVASQVLSWDVLIKSGAAPVMTADGRTDLDLTAHFVNGREAGIEANILMMVKADSGQYATEKTAAEAQSLRAVRLQADGTSSRQLQLDFLAKHAQGSLFKVDEQDGYDIVQVRLVTATDLTNAFRAKVVNAVSTLV